MFICVCWFCFDSYQDVSEGKLPFSPEDQPKEEVEDLGEEDIEKLLWDRLAAFEEELREEKFEKVKSIAFNFTCRRNTFCVYTVWI